MWEKVPFDMTDLLRYTDTRISAPSGTGDFRPFADGAETLARALMPDYTDAAVE